jgi:integrase
LRTADVDELITALESEGKAPGTVRNIITPLRKMLGDAIRQGLIVANPAEKTELPPAQDFAGKEIANEDVASIRAALIDLAPFDPLGGRPDVIYVCLFDVALGTGLRLGELRALRWQDVDRDRRLIRVERAYSRRELKRPKTEAGARSVPLFASVQAALQAMAARAVERGRYAPDELVFATARGTPLHESNVNRRVWRPALKQAGLAERGYRWHDLRHTCVSRLVAAGADIKLVQAVAGHSSPLMTLKRYSHLLDARVTEAAERFDPARVP